MAESTHLMKPRPPVRAFALAALLVVLGAALAVLPDALHWPVALIVLGVVLIVAGLGLLWVAVNAMRTMRVRVVLDDQGFRVEGPGEPRQGSWTDITRVTRSPGRITLHRRDGGQTHLVVPRGGSADLAALGADIVRRLDASRGYRQSETTS